MITPPTTTSLRRAHLIGAVASVLIVLMMFSAISAALGVFGVPNFVHFAVGTFHGLVLAACLMGLVRAMNRVG